VRPDDRRHREAARVDLESQLPIEVMDPDFADGAPGRHAANHARRTPTLVVAANFGRSVVICRSANLVRRQAVL
jgi:hypothetical protein